MRRPMAKKVFAATMAAAMTMSVVACGGNDDGGKKKAKGDDVSPYTVIKDADGKTVDLGGMEIIIRDWYTGDPGEPQNDYQEAVLAYHEWLQETYNFTLKQTAISDWGSVPGDFVDYCSTGGDDNNYLFILRPDPAITSAISNNLVYDLATLDCLDLDNDPVFANHFHDAYTYGDSVYVVYPGRNEPRTGVWFNTRILEDAGIKADDLYDMQANGTWTWDKFEELCKQVQVDKDNDGTNDIYGFCVNNGDFTKAAIYSNGGAYIDKDASGKFRYALGDAESMEALQWTVDMFKNYQWQAPADAQWDAYKGAFVNGEAAFCVEGEYYANGNNSFDAMEDEVGFVMFPKGRSSKAKLTNVWDNNLHCIPGCYDADRAWKIAFAFDQWVQVPAGYEDVDSFVDNARSFGLLGGRALTETIPMMETDEFGMTEVYSAVPGLNLGPDFAWGFGSWSVPSEAEAGIRGTWQSYVDDANNR